MFDKYIIVTEGFRNANRHRRRPRHRRLPHCYRGLGLSMVESTTSPSTAGASTPSSSR